MRTQITLGEVIERKGAINPVSRGLLDIAISCRDLFPGRPLPITFWLTDEDTIEIDMEPTFAEEVKKHMESEGQS